MRGPQFALLGGWRSGGGTGWGGDLEGALGGEVFKVEGLLAKPQ